MLETSNAGSASGSDEKAPELRISRVFNAPRHLVFDAWTKPDHLARWWGPTGFTTPHCKVDVRTGGSFNLSMRGPDGTEYPFEGVYEEVVVPERIVFTGMVHDGNKARAVVTFTPEGDKTRVDLHQTYTIESPATRGAQVGWTQSLDRLDAVLASH